MTGSSAGWICEDPTTIAYTPVHGVFTASTQNAVVAMLKHKKFIN